MRLALFNTWKSSPYRPPIFYFAEKTNLLEGVRQQTAMTHNNPNALACVGLIAVTGWGVLQRISSITAMGSALEEGVADIDLDSRILAWA